MIIKKLSFDNFRNLEAGEIYPDSGINVIYGNNAQGKTNLLEALWLFTGGHSFRGNKDKELPRLIDGVNSLYCKLSADFYSFKREQNAEIIIKDGKKTCSLNGIGNKSAAYLVGKICAVIFSPEHLDLIKEGPSKRRAFIDAAICQIKPSYASILSKYNRVVTQRNALIKELFKNPYLSDTLDIWNERMASLGSDIINERLKYIEALKPYVKDIYSGMSSEKEKLDLDYICSFNTKNDGDIYTSFRKALDEAYKSDVNQGFSTVGPHRDDLALFIDNKSVRSFGSQGQQRSCVLSLKLSEAKMLEKSVGEAPIILLDDVMSELDNKRQDYLLNHLTDKQVFITCCSPETVNLLKKGKTFYMENGEVIKKDL
ncbi:MAG: DNA replication/repair protein RecF [Clostridia bacterium]|nr:DNA replication/repair protein RecF [Clostridia bacterium]